MKRLIIFILLALLWVGLYYAILTHKLSSPTYKVALYNGQLIEGAHYNGGDDLKEFTIGGKRVFIPREQIALMVQE